MMNLLICIILISLWCNGLFAITAKGMIFEKLDLILAKLPEPLYDPILGCITCMASVHGIMCCLVLLPFTMALFWQIPMCCVGAAALNNLIYKISDNG